MNAVKDQNGKTLTKSIKRNQDGTWGRTVWFGGMYGFATNVRRYTYDSKKSAQAGDISDFIGKNGRLA